MFTVTTIIRYLIGRGHHIPSGHLCQSGHQHSTLHNPGILLEMVKSVIPSLTATAHKGECGRIGVIGGCQEYTGAPYFAAISALKLGADLAHVFCTKDSATVIKSYSPELIVHPVLDSPTAVSEVNQWLPRLHAVVVGPGLGRDSQVHDNVRNIIEKVKDLRIPLVVDADGLFLVTENPDVIKNYEQAILTPNVVEFERLYVKMVGEKPDPAEPVASVRTLCKKLGHVTIVKKGENDIISDGNHVLVCSGEGSPRRCGGQGDLLSGTMGTFTYWAHKFNNDPASLSDDCEPLTIFGPTLCAAYAACQLTRECSRRAYRLRRRAMTTSDMIDQIQESFEHLYSNL